MRRISAHTSRRLPALPARVAALAAMLALAALALAPAPALALRLSPASIPTSASAVQAQIDALRHGSDGTRVAAFAAGKYAGKNVIIIQVEALQALVIGKKYGGQEITPNLDKLIKQSWYFPNTYSETSVGNTVDAEFTVNSGLYSPTYSAASLVYADSEIPGLPRLLRANGYDAVTLHQNDVRFWNRIDLYPALGFRRWWDKSYFGLRDKMWHASDEVLFRMGMAPLKTEAKTGKPFYSFFITESSHIPYKVIPRKRYAVKISNADFKTLSGRYVGSVSYTDKAIGEFVSALKKAGLWSKSIVVIYGDHSAELDMSGKANARLANKLLGRTYGNVDRQRIPLIIHLPGQTAETRVTQPAGQVDIMPSIADLVGLDISRVPHMGRSVFVAAPSYIPFRAYEPGGAFVDDSVMFLPGASAESSSVVGVRSAMPGVPTATENDWAAIRDELDTISDTWMKSLPIRPDATFGKTAIIP